MGEGKSEGKGRERNGHIGTCFSPLRALFRSNGLSQLRCTRWRSSVSHIINDTFSSVLSVCISKVVASLVFVGFQPPLNATHTTHLSVVDFHKLNTSASYCEHHGTSKTATADWIPDLIHFIINL